MNYDYADFSGNQKVCFQDIFLQSSGSSSEMSELYTGLLVLISHQPFNYTRDFKLAGH